MSSRSKQEVYLPRWLWFFLILPIGLLVALLYRQKQVQQFARRLGVLPQRLTPVRRYTEPDSIPLEIRPEVPPSAGEGAQTSGVNAEQVQPASPDFPAQEDLTIVEGIGPKISSLLREAGIFTFGQLAGTPVERLDDILTKASLRRLADPATWPEQARLAASGDWDGLLQLQKSLKGGRRVGLA